jgi:hypothetical protein
VTQLRRPVGTSRHELEGIAGAHRRTLGEIATRRPAPPLLGPGRGGSAMQCPKSKIEMRRRMRWE